MPSDKYSKVEHSKNQSWLTKMFGFIWGKEKPQPKTQLYKTIDVPEAIRLQEGDVFEVFSETIDNRFFTVAKTLGKGGFGTVYKVSNGTEEYACKILDLWRQQPGDWESLNSRFDRGFKAGQIDSEYLVDYSHKGTVRGNPCIMMELCEGGNLAERIEDFKGEQKFEGLALKVLQGLNDLHLNGIVHRDIKPENILFDNNDNPKLTDFDISVFLNKRQTIRNWRGFAKEVWGTAVYAPPEQLDHKLAYDKAKPAMDMFAFGVTMYEVASQGKYPFGDYETFERDPLEYYEKVKEGKFISLRNYCPHFSDLWISAIDGCLHPNPDKRVSSPNIILQKFALPSEKNKDTFIPATHKKWILTIKNGEESGKYFNLSEALEEKENNEIYIGRYSKNVRGNDVSIQETYTMYISRKHTTLKFKDGQWFAKDGQQEKDRWKESVNGTMINDRDIDDKKYYEIYHGDILCLAADVTMKLEYKNLK